MNNPDLLDRAVQLFAEKAATGNWRAAKDYIKIAARLAGVESVTVPPDEDE